MSSGAHCRLGAIESHRHELITVRTSGTISAANVTESLDLISVKHPEVPVTLVMDNGRDRRRITLT